VYIEIRQTRPIVLGFEPRYQKLLSLAAIACVGEEINRRSRRATSAEAALTRFSRALNVTSSRRQRIKELQDSERLERGRVRVKLIQRWQQGDPNACQELLDDIGPSLTRFLRRRVADPRELEDVYQEVFMAIFEARHTYQPGRPFEPWLFAIARNIAVDYSRRRWARSHWEELVAEPPERPADVSNAAAPELGEVLAGLPPDQRDAFSMLKLDGLSVEKAAARAGVSVGALRVRAHRAYKSLKRLIGE
jgi:RNA polymerase sigma-70 factor, ECF subfamily